MYIYTHISVFFVARNCWPKFSFIGAALCAFWAFVFIIYLFPNICMFSGTSTSTGKSCGKMP